MSTLRVLIVDDEPLARQTLQLIVEREGCKIVGSCSGPQAIDLIPAMRPDVVFLDVEMPGAGGFDVISAVGVDTVPVVIFVTAYNKHALRAFEVHALDYVLKPFNDSRIVAALTRARAQLSVPAPDRTRLEAMLAQTKRRFCVRERGRVLFFEVGEIDWLGGADDYVELHIGTLTHLVRGRLADLERQLDEKQFARVHRSAIVNLSRVRELQRKLRGDAVLVLRSGTQLRLSRSRRAEFERRLAISPHRKDNSPQTE